MKIFLIDILAFAALLSSVLVITSKNPVIAVIFLISVFLNAAGYLILSGVGFIGISYIIVYVGAIAILFLFVIMMINIKLIDVLETGNQYTKNLPLALAIGSLFIYEIFSILPFTFNNVSGISALLDTLTNLNSLFLSSNISSVSTVNTAFSPVIADTAFTNFLQIEAIGQGLYTYGAFWLILTSVILLLSMVAPIFISRKSNKSNPFFKLSILPFIFYIKDEIGSINIPSVIEPSLFDQYKDYLAGLPAIEQGEIAHIFMSFTVLMCLASILTAYFG